MNRQNSKQAKKQVLIDAMRYCVDEMIIHFVNVVLTCCRTSVWTYRLAVVHRYWRMETVTYRDISVLMYGNSDEMKYGNKHVHQWLNVGLHK